MTQRLSVETRDLVQALKDLRIGLKQNTSQRASLTYADGLLEIALRGAAVRIDADGRWRGTAHVAVQPLATLARVPPKDQRLDIIYEDGRVKIGTMRLAAEWQDIGPPQLDLPLDAGILDYLALKVHRSPTEITASGLDSQLQRFEEQADKILARAERVLSPLEVTRRELWQMLWEKLRARPDPAR